jgi:hypothetical protein
MFTINLKRSVGALAVIAGLLAVAGPASAQGGGADFTRLEDRPQRGIILAGTGDDQMVTDTQQGRLPQQDRAITMLDYEGTPVVTYSSKDNPQGYMVDVIWQGYANALSSRAGGEVISADAY